MQMAIAIMTNNTFFILSFILIVVPLTIITNEHRKVNAKNYVFFIIQDSIVKHLLKVNYLLLTQLSEVGSSSMSEATEPKLA